MDTPVLNERVESLRQLYRGIVADLAPLEANDGRQSVAYAVESVWIRLKPIPGDLSAVLTLVEEGKHQEAERDLARVEARLAQARLLTAFAQYVEREEP